MRRPRQGHSAGLRTIAGIEATKGVLVLVAGLGLLELVHRDVQAAAEELVGHLHLSPSARYPRIFLELAAQVTNAWVWMLAAGALLYATLRLVEAFGLWRDKRWAKWLGAGSGAVYVPFEVVGILEKMTALRVASLVVNLLVVAYLLRSLHAGRAARR
jgi:uncharacterized membrane protein (DUF2068 family)